MITIPNGVTVDINGQQITVKGPKGTVKKQVPKKIKIEKNNSSLLVSGSESEKALLGTYNSLLQSMFKGVTEGYTKKLKALYAHFPVSFEVKGKSLIIKNFLGEKNPRKSKIVGDETKVEAKGVMLTVSGPDAEAVGQTVANIKSALRIKAKDPRVFQDGIYEVSE